MDSSQQGTSADAERRRPVGGAATAATILILLLLVHEVVISVANWREYSAVHDYLAGAMTDAELKATADSLSALESWLGFWPSFLVWLVAGVAFLAWLWRTRVNGELMSGADAHRRSRAWVVGAWVSPVINLWYPYQVVSDIWQASAPRRPASVALVNAWWASFLAANLVKPIQWRAASQLATEQDVLANANLSTLLTGLYLVAGALIILIIRRITAWQTVAA
ncbi:DUF4328 domain-containing protein [Streptomyces sp. NPDC048483]|uniref:DUF4328 domain-containing protein n=1 Tax=Streptomyces sp. NPDC048483 TaxID=3154927 RepID=UPI0034319D15